VQDLPVMLDARCLVVGGGVGQDAAPRWCRPTG